MKSLQLILLTGLLAITSASYAETDLSEAFRTAYYKNDKSAHDPDNQLITIVQYNIKRGSEIRGSLPRWFTDSTKSYKRSENAKYLESISKLLSTQYLHKTNNGQFSTIAKVTFDIPKICNLISMWSTSECEEDFLAIQVEQDAQYKNTINSIVAKANAQKINAQEQYTNLKQSTDELITGTMGYNLGDKANLSITTCTPFHEELLMGYKKASEAKALYLTRSNLGFGPDQLRNIEIKFDIANSSSSVTPAFCIVKAKQKSGLFDSVAIELNEKTKIISSIYAYKNYGTVNKRDLAASYNQCNTDLEGLSDAIKNKYNSEDGKSLSGFKRSLNAFCGGGDLSKKGKFEVRLFLAYSDKALRKETYQELFAMHSAKKSNAADKFAGDI